MRALSRIRAGHRSRLDAAEMAVPDANAWPGLLRRHLATDRCGLDDARDPHAGWMARGRLVSLAISFLAVHRRSSIRNRCRCIQDIASADPGTGGQACQRARL